MDVQGNSDNEFTTFMDNPSWEQRVRNFLENISGVVTSTVRVLSLTVRTRGTARSERSMSAVISNRTF